MWKRADGDATLITETLRDNMVMPWCNEPALVSALSLPLCALLLCPPGESLFVRWELLNSNSPRNEEEECKTEENESARQPTRFTT